MKLWRVFDAGAYGRSEALAVSEPGPKVFRCMHRKGRECNHHGMPHLLPWPDAPPLKLILCRVCNEVIGLGTCRHLTLARPELSASSGMSDAGFGMRI